SVSARRRATSGAVLAEDLAERVHDLPESRAGQERFLHHRQQVLRAASGFLDSRERRADRRSVLTRFVFSDAGDLALDRLLVDALNRDVDRLVLDVLVDADDDFFAHLAGKLALVRVLGDRGLDVAALDGGDGAA